MWSKGLHYFHLAHDSLSRPARQPAPGTRSARRRSICRGGCFSLGV
jgi:hypothetical protein